MRAVHSLRNSRLRTRRSRKAYTRARISVTSDWRYRLWRLRRNPLVSLRRRFRLRRTVLPLRARVMASRLPTLVCELRGGPPRRLCVAAHDDAVLPAQLPRFDHGGPELPLALAGLRAGQVLLGGRLALQLAGGGDPEALFGALVRFHLRHGLTQPRFVPGPRAGLRPAFQKKRALGQDQGSPENRPPLSPEGKGHYREKL